MACSTKASPESHSSLPSHQFRNAFTGLTLFATAAETNVPRSAGASRSPESEATTCLIAGGEPAGMMLALLLAGAGVKVTVMEKHADFLRDFRGDTVHASTLRPTRSRGTGLDRPVGPGAKAPLVSDADSAGGATDVPFQRDRGRGGRKQRRTTRRATGGAGRWHCGGSSATWWRSARCPSVRRGMPGAARSQQRLNSKIMDAEQVGGR